MCLSFLSPITIQATSAVEFESSHSIVWMKAVKALQEAMAKIETLEAKVEALENA